MKIPSNLPEYIFTFLFTKVLKRNKRYPFFVNTLIFFSVPIFRLLQKIVLRIYTFLLGKYKKHKESKLPKVTIETIVK